MNKKSTTPTMKDVAREAGVSLGTVSNVFNGAQVSETYRVKVEEAARKLGYKVNRYARGLKTNQTKTIAFICPNNSDSVTIVGTAQSVKTSLCESAKSKSMTLEV